MLSQAVEDYLKAIYTLHNGKPVTTSELSARLGVSSASVTNMMTRLAKMKLVTYAPYRGVALTAAGEKIALEIIRHHRLLETYLRDVLGYAWEQMHSEAEHLEHHISEEFEDRIDALLGYPTHDPHGDPIPTRDGTMEHTPADPLPACPHEQDLEVRRLLDTDHNMLHRIEDLGLLPGTVFRILDADDELLVVHLDHDHISVPADVAAHIFAAPV